ncbi:MAG TPA: phosphatase PAP2 family protein [Chitinophagaceae bacterium]|nr:phosphatase PAP2 family protein [Chitinophagaceae bacterium]
MKRFILSAMIMVAAITPIQMKAQNKTANYEAATWKTKLLDNPGEIRVMAPPGVTATKKELEWIKQRVTKPDEKTMADIKYWDAGAPSYRWNQIILKAISWDNPDLILRTPQAWINIAIYDATIVAWKEKARYRRKRPHEVDPSIKPVIHAPSTFSYPCEHSVTAAAAATVFAYFMPAKGDSILKLARAASQSRVDAGVQFQSDVEAGWALGEQVAKEIIEKAKKDGYDKKYEGQINKDPKKWTGAFAMGINLPLMKPLAIRTVDQFRPAPPPDFESEMNDLKNFKQTFRSRYLAYHWASIGPGFWSDVASQKMFEYRMSDDAPAVARIYATLNTAFHDMAIAVFDAKYAYWGIRPAQYDTTFKPLLLTPPFPGYPSGHAAGAGTSSAVLEYFFPADAKQFQQMAQDCADSRFYAGIHFKSDNEVALSMGKELGRYIAENWMKQ